MTATRQMETAAKMLTEATGCWSAFKYHKSVWQQRLWTLQMNQTLSQPPLIDWYVADKLAGFCIQIHPLVSIHSSIHPSYIGIPHLEHRTFLLWDEGPHQWRVRRSSAPLPLSSGDELADLRPAQGRPETSRGAKKLIWSWLSAKAGLRAPVGRAGDLCRKQPGIRREAVLMPQMTSQRSRGRVSFIALQGFNFRSVVIPISGMLMSCFLPVACLSKI